MKGRMTMKGFQLVLSFTVAVASLAAHANPGGVNPLEVQVEIQDALRFAKIFNEKNGVLSKEDIQKHYLDGAGQGVKVFTPHRIENAENMAGPVKEEAKHYRYAIEKCLPILPSLNAELRATYLAFRGLLPNQPLPRVSVVFGARNSGGTADKDNQVIGLEVMCSEGTSVDDFRQRMRSIFAHETVHSMQSHPKGDNAYKDLLLIQAILEGAPDYIASIVTGREPSPHRETWGRPQEAKVWAQFEADRQVILNRKGDDLSKEPVVLKAFQRWFGNAFNAPEGMPSEAGYWVGMQIAKAYVEQATDKTKAFNDLLSVGNAQMILEKSGYAKRMAQPAVKSK
jgi:hypothetical protein